jgi:spore coat polysaccharide biosynthesis protein SpsF (cytidylyltransferase family)
VLAPAAAPGGGGGWQGHPAAGLNQFCPAPRHRASNNPAVQLTGGNPFYVTEVVQAGLGTVPSSARDAVLARAARLSGGSREVLDVAALVGARVELDLLRS